VRTACERRQSSDCVEKLGFSATRRWQPKFDLSERPVLNNRQSVGHFSTPENSSESSAASFSTQSSDSGQSCLDRPFNHVNPILSHSAANLPNIGRMENVLDDRRLSPPDSIGRSAFPKWKH
jgi:hypothetical protein